jgi:hypothetical protein
MSFEGRYQKLCPNGHYEEQDVYLETNKCEICGEKWERLNLVDDTEEYHLRDVEFLVRKINESLELYKKEIDDKQTGEK